MAQGIMSTETTASAHTAQAFFMNNFLFRSTICL